MHLTKAIIVVCATLAQHGVAILADGEGKQEAPAKEEAKGTCGDKGCKNFMITTKTCTLKPAQRIGEQNMSDCTREGYHFCCPPIVTEREQYMRWQGRRGEEPNEIEDVEGQGSEQSTNTQSPTKKQETPPFEIPDDWSDSSDSN